MAHIFYGLLYEFNDKHMGLDSVDPIGEIPLYSFEFSLELIFKNPINSNWSVFKMVGSLKKGKTFSVVHVPQLTRFEQLNPRLRAFHPLAGRSDGDMNR